MPELALPPPRPHLPQPDLVDLVPRRWWRRAVTPDDLLSAHWQDVRAHVSEPTPGGGTALLLCDLGPDADPDLVALADRLLLPGEKPAADGYADVVPVFLTGAEELVHALLRVRTSGYAERYARTDAWHPDRPPTLVALDGTVDAKNDGLHVGTTLRYARCGAVHLVAADPLVRETTLDHLRERGWPVALPYPV